MTLQKYIDKLSWASAPARQDEARIVLRYSAGRAAKVHAQEGVEDLQDTFDSLVALADRGFLGMQGLVAAVAAPAGDLLEVRLAAEPLPHDLVVIALRLVISANDNDPADFQMLLNALDGDMKTALEAYGGTNFEEEVAEVSLSVAGVTSSGAFDPFHLGAAPGPLRHARRLLVQDAAPHMPDADTEDHILRLSGMRAFLPVGVQPEYEPGEEAYFPQGDNLVLDRVSIEAASLHAILSMLAPGRAHTVREDD